MRQRTSRVRLLVTHCDRLTNRLLVYLIDVSKKIYADPLSFAEWERRQQEYRKRVSSLFHPMGELMLDIPQSWLVDGLLPDTYLAVLAGPPKSGKTAFATALALAVASGTPFATAMALAKA